MDNHLIGQRHKRLQNNTFILNKKRLFLTEKSLLFSRTEYLKK